LVMASEYAKVSVSLPSSLVDRIRDKVGTRGLSAYVSRALEAEERREALRAWLANEEVEHGPIPHDVLEEVRHQWLGDAGAAP
jgi:Arc/MetJ-type ribon-helix-helix transcriptional regulator